MTSTASTRTSQPVLVLCGVLWAGSYLVPIYLLPITMFASLWMAVLVWGFALSGSSAGPAAGAPSMPTLVPAVLLVGLAALAGLHRIDHTAVLLTAAAVFFFSTVERDERWLRTLLWALLAAGLASAAIAAVQLLVHGAALPGIAPLSDPGRATANLRQPNMLASLLLMSACAAIGLHGGGAQDRARSMRFVLATLVLGMGVGFSQARTGFLCVALLCLWALLDRRLPRVARAMPWAMAAGCLVGIALVALNAHFGQGEFYLERRITTASDISNSRFGIWANTLALIAQHPLWGVGWGRFAVAWALTPFPGRPVAAFDHAHNLPLQLMVEIGVPLALLVLGTLAWSLWRARASWRAVDDARAPMMHSLWMLLATIGLHSLLEYPLWYVYVLLPAAYVFGVLVREGLALDGAGRQTALPAGPAAPWPSALLRTCGVLIVFGSLYAAWDYARVLQAFSPFGPGLRKSLEQRVAEGRKSVLFGAWVDYGLVTNAERFEGLEPAIRRAMGRNFNPHLMLVYAQSLHERGDDDKARYVVERLREFRHPIATDFLAACDQQPPIQPRPFQCTPPAATTGYRDLD